MAAELEPAGEHDGQAQAANQAKQTCVKHGTVDKKPDEQPAQRSPPTNQSRPTEDDLTQKLMEVCQELEATPETFKKHTEFLIWMDRVLKQHHGRNARLEAFGSTVCGFTTRNSDLDLTFHVIDASFSHEEKKEHLKALSKTFRFRHGLSSFAVLNARVPVVKLKDPHSGLCADLSVQNELPVFKSKLLALYNRIDHRFKPLVLAVKSWAQGRGINSAAHGTLNSFGFTLLVLHFLQNTEPPILPRLTDATIQLKGRARERAEAAGRGAAVTLPEHPQGQVGQVVVHHHSGAGALEGWGSDNGRGAGPLLGDFFRYFVEEFDFCRRVVSVTRPAGECGAWQEELERGALRLHPNQEAALLLHDPLDPMDNVARTVNRAARDKIVAELHRAYSMVCEGALGELLEEVRSSLAQKPSRPGKKKTGGKGRGEAGKGRQSGATPEAKEEEGGEAAGGSVASGAERGEPDRLAEALMRSHLEELGGEAGGGGRRRR